LARAISKGSVVDFLEVSEGYSLAEIDVPEAVRGKTLAEADLRKRTGVTVLCIRRNDTAANKPLKIVIPQASDVLMANDKLIVFGETKHLDTLS
jgi:trk system potassium uptake protein TrkA